METPSNEPNPPPKPSTSLWAWGLIVFYVAGVVLLAWHLPWRDLFAAIEGWTCVFAIPLMVIAGVAYGTQDKDLWT